MIEQFRDRKEFEVFRVCFNVYFVFGGLGLQGFWWIERMQLYGFEGSEFKVQGSGFTRKGPGCTVKASDWFLVGNGGMGFWDYYRGP